MNFSDTRNATVIATTPDGYYIYHRGGGRYPYGIAHGCRTLDMAMTLEGAWNAIRDSRERSK